MNAMAKTLLDDMFARAMTGQADQVGEEMKLLYGTYASEFLPVIQSVKPLLEAVGGDVSEVVAMIAAGFNAGAENANLQAEANRSNALKAAARMRKLKAYTTAGFTREEAMAFILADAAAIQTAMRQALTQASGSAKASRPAPKQTTGT